MGKRPKPRYRGKLAEPQKPLLTMPLARALSGMSPDEAVISAEEARDQLRAEVLEKLRLLLDHYGISRDDKQYWRNLALALARDHVPGFQIAQPTKRGPKKSWMPDEEIRLHMDVSGLVQKGQTVRSACFNLANRAIYRDRRRNSEALRRRFQKNRLFFEALPAPLRNHLFQLAHGRLEEPGAQKKN